jgi:hypothetical protein
MLSIAHAGFVVQIVGKNTTADKLCEYSNQLQVTAKPPPKLLVPASYDDGVSTINSFVFYDSLVTKMLMLSFIFINLVNIVL